MAISQRAAGTWAVATTQSPTVTIPAGYQAGDLGILVSVWRPFSVTATVNQSWIEIVDETPGSTANGIGVGSSRVYVAYKVLGASETNPTITRSGAITPGGQVIVVFQKSATDGAWTVEKLANAVEQAMGSTAMSHNLTTSAAIKASDLVWALTGVADDSATFTRATTAISGGPSWSGNVVEYPATHASSTTGNDMAADLIYRVASSDQASGATITVTATLSAAERVASVLFRVYASQVLTAGLIDGSATTYAPTLSQGAQDLTAGLINGNATTYAPTLTPKSTLTAGLVNGSATVYAPTLTPKSTLTAGLIDGGAATYGPTITPTNTLTAGLIDASATTYAPTLSTVSTLTVGLIDAGATTFAPTLSQGAQVLTAGLIDASATVSAPTLTQISPIVAGLIDGGAATFAPTLSAGPVSLTAGLIDGSATVYAPTVSPLNGIGPGFIDAAGAVYAPTLTQGPATITLDLIDAAAAVYAVQVVGGEVAVTDAAGGGGLRRLRAAGRRPKVALLSLPVIDARRSVYAPTIEQTDDELVLEMLLL